MNVFTVGKEFADWASVKEAKKQYEDESKSILSTRGSHLLKSKDDASKRCIYADAVLWCKAGKERKSQSQGLRMSSTYKMNCTFQ